MLKAQHSTTCSPQKAALPNQKPKIYGQKKAYTQYFAAWPTGRCPSPDAPTRCAGWPPTATKSKRMRPCSACGTKPNRSADNLVVVVTLSAAAKIEPISGFPRLGIPGDWSKPNEYKVTAANGSTKKWTFTITGIDTK